MEKHQTNKLRMYRVIEKVLEDNAVKWNTIPAFVNAKNSFSAQVTVIHNTSMDHMQVTTGITADKRQLKIALAAGAAAVAGAVSAYADATMNAELGQAVKFTQRTLFKCRDNRMLSHCKNIHDRALDHAPALVPYGITAVKLNDLQIHINRFLAEVPKPRAAQAHKQSLTKSLKISFANADRLLKLHLDNLMLVFKTTDPGFYNTYKAGRVIFDLGQMHTRLRLTARDTQGLPLKGAIVYLMHDSQTIYTHTTGADGLARISLIKPGIYNIVVHKEGYSGWSQKEITFISGKRLTRSVVLAGDAV